MVRRKWVFLDLEDCVLASNKIYIGTEKEAFKKFLKDKDNFQYDKEDVRIQEGD